MRTNGFRSGVEEASSSKNGRDDLLDSLESLLGDSCTPDSEAKVLEPCKEPVPYLSINSCMEQLAVSKRGEQ